MKSALSAGLVAALLCPAAVIAGSTCPKTAHGSNRITCRVDVDRTERHEKDQGHHKRGHKNEVEIKRTVDTYTWSFFWKYIITDDCPKTMAHLSSIIPWLANTHHQVKCRVEIGWAPDHGPHGDTFNGRGNESLWDYDGHSQIDWTSLPAKMSWPLYASIDRPEHFHGKSGELGAKYEKANTGEDEFTFDIHHGDCGDFSHCWGHDDRDEHSEFREIDEGHHGKNGKNDKRGHKKQEIRTSVSDHHRKFGGHYDTKNLYSCWVFEKYHHITRQSTERKEKKKGKHGDKNDNDDYNMGPIVPYHSPSWSTCEPHLPLPPPCEEECHGDSCAPKQDDCKGESCGGKQQGDNNCNGGDCGGKQEVSQGCQGASCGGKQDVAKGCHGRTCGRGEEDCDDDDCSDDGSDDDCEDDCSEDDPSDSDDGSDDDCEDDCTEDDPSDSDDGSDDDCEDDCTEDEDKHRCGC